MMVAVKVMVKVSIGDHCSQTTLWLELERGISLKKYSIYWDTRTFIH